MRAGRMIGAIAVASALVLAGCSDDGDSTDGAQAPSGENGAANGGDQLTTEDRDAFLAALTAGTLEGEGYINCVAGKVKEAVDAGAYSAQEVRDWSDGKQLDTPLQEFITSSDVVTACMIEARDEEG